MILWVYGSFDMGARMKTTIDLNDALFQAAKDTALREGTTLRTVVETALRQYLDTQAARSRAPFQLRRHAFGGGGLQPEAAAAGWDRIRDLSYEGRGG